MLPIIDSILSIVGKFLPDQGSRDELKGKLSVEITKQMKMQSDIIRAEQKSSSWITANWRPLFSLLCCTMIGSHWVLYDVFPYIRTALDLNIWLPQDPGLDPELWITIRICLGGYIGSRSAEKIARIIKS